MSDNGTMPVVGAVHRTRRDSAIPVVRRMFTGALALLAALFVLTAVAQPAFADDPGATIFPHDYDSAPNFEIAQCATPYRTGVLGQYGAWGYFVDGCTVKSYCPNYAGSAIVRCKATGFGIISTLEYLGHQVTLNSRVRVFSGNGSLLGWEDRSCVGIKFCQVDPPAVQFVWAGQAASEQCNGVRQNASLPNTARVRCILFLEYLYT